MSKLLILDYSLDRGETALTQRWVPAEVHVDSLFIDAPECYPADLLDRGYDFVVHTGSALSINDVQSFTASAIRHIEGFRERGAAQLGICYGQQLLSYALVGPHGVRRSPAGIEAGWRAVQFSELGQRLLNVGPEEVVWQSHFDEVVEMPPGSELIASNAHTRVQGFINQSERLLGTQFHPEFDEEKGNAQYAKERRFLEKHGIDVDAEVRGGPSFDTGRTVLEFFVGHFGSPPR